MPTLSTNNYLRRGAEGPTGIAIDLTVTPPGGIAGQIAAGDMCYLTAGKQAASLSTPGAANANAANFIGVSIDTFPRVIAQGITAGAATSEIPAIALRISGEFLFYTTAADVYSPGDTVYLGADAQTVAKTVSGTAVGVVAVDQTPSPTTVQGTSISGPITGAAGVLIVVKINPAIKV